MPTVMGIDPSTKTGVVVLDRESGKVIQALVVNFSEQRGFKRLQLIAKSLLMLATEHKPEVIVIEGYAFGNRHSLVTLVEIGTIIRQALFSSGYSWYDVPPTTLKKLTTGSGAAKKDKMAVAVKERWGFESKSDDVVDGFALAQLAKEIAASGVTKAMKGVSCYENQ